MKWIKPTEQLPDSYQAVLIKIKVSDRNTVVTGAYKDDDFWRDPMPTESSDYRVPVETESVLEWAPIGALEGSDSAPLREEHANESLADQCSHDIRSMDRALFVMNLGELLSQTRAGVFGCELDPDTDTVTITYNNGYQKKVDVACDSYKAIIQDVTRAI